MNFKNKVVWITGASSGIGEALTYLFHKMEAIVIISARNQVALEKVKNNCKSNSYDVYIQPLDLFEQKSFPQIVKNILNQFGQIDLLINNGGISQRSLATKTTLKVDKRIMEVNYFGTIALTKTILPSMIERQSGQIVITSSILGKMGVPLRSAYAASKHALHGYFDTIRAELSNDNIHISLICPGYVRTNVSYNALTADGSPLREMKETTNRGMSPQLFAQKAIKAIYYQKAEVVIASPKVLLATYIKRFFPSLMRYILSRSKEAYG